MKKSHKRGFSLLEAMAAMIVAGIGLGAFYGAVSQISRLALSAAEAARAVRHQENLLAVAQVINPAETPEGRIELDGYVVEWTSEAVVDPAPILRPDGRKAPFDAGLYRLDLRTDGRAEIAISVRRDGWSLVRPTADFRRRGLRSRP